ncbi:MAG: deoxyribodipyrimidine photolyase [Beijerinckiaceae bacterium]|nr:deoxyribodipyrimidine photolyase [Beijerinckiaceae bacterium]
MTFEPTREAGLRQLRAFLPNAGRRYAEQRNFDFGADKRDNVSVLSPYLRHRLVTEREVAAAVLERHGPQAPFKFLQEVFWRTYWKGWLEAHPDVWQRYRATLETLHHDMPSGLRKAVESATAGMTGIDAFDHWVHELNETGYLHNHARMWFASIWVFTLRLPWELGAEFFLHHLIDGDPASNTLSWRWVAGLQTKGKTYLATADNISRYTEGRFAPQSLATRAVPLDEPPLAAARPLPLGDQLPRGEDFVLLLCEEDLGIETLGLDKARIRTIGLTSIEDRRTLAGASPGVKTFTQGALEDTAARSRALFPDAPVMLAKPDSLIDWLQSTGIKLLVTPYCPVGPAQEALDALRDEIERLGVRRLSIRRSWDSHAWPHAGKGFFQLGNNIPRILDAEGLPAG